MSNGIHAELQSACAYVLSLGYMMPAGIRVPARAYDNVKKSLRTKPGGVLFSGSLSQLDLQRQAMTMLDFDHLGYIIENSVTDEHLNVWMEVIIVNVDAGNDSQGRRG